MTIYNPPETEPDWSVKRKFTFPDIFTQLDMLYWDKKNGTNKWVEAIDKVKSDIPKS